MPTDKNIKSPDILYSHFEKYREECKKSPKLENIYNYKADRTVPIEREIPLTWVGFENYLRRKKIITTLQDYEFNKDGRYKEYITIVRAIKNEIYEDKYNGAVAGIFQHNIIARDLGLVDRKDMTTDDNPIQALNIIVDKSETAKTLKSLRDGGSEAD